MKGLWYVFLVLFFTIVAGFGMFFGGLIGLGIAAALGIIDPSQIDWL